MIYHVGGLGGVTLAKSASGESWPTRISKYISYTACSKQSIIHINIISCKYMKIQVSMTYRCIGDFPIEIYVNRLKFQSFYDVATAFFYLQFIIINNITIILPYFIVVAQHFHIYS